MRTLLIFRMLVGVAIALLLTAIVTSHWQIIGIHQPPIRTNIGLWQLCSKTQDNSYVCQATKVDSSHNLILYVIRFLTILSVIVACVGMFIGNKTISLILIGTTILLSGLSTFFYSTQLENYFSENFDKLMYSRYGYSYYIQCTAIIILLAALLLSCLRS